MQAQAVAWLKAKREEIGLAALGKMVEVDAANLAKVIDRKRRLTATTTVKILARA